MPSNKRYASKFGGSGYKLPQDQKHWTQRAASVVGGAVTGFQNLPPEARSAAWQGVKMAFRGKRRRTEGSEAAVAGGSFLSGFKRSYLRKKDTLYRQKPSVSTLCSTLVERWQNMKKENPEVDPDVEGGGFPGGLPVSKGTVEGDTVFMPCYVWNLTLQQNNPGIYKEVAHRLTFDNAGQPFFPMTTNQASDGSNLTLSSWQIERAAGIGSPVFQYRAKSQIMWYDIRLKLYGARKQSTSYDVYLCRFTKEHLVPQPGLAPVILPDTEDNLEYKAFWQQLARAKIVNSIMPETAKWRKGWQIMRHKRVSLPASSTTDLDKTAESVDFKWFVKDSKIRSYENLSNTFSADTQIDSVSWIVNTTNYINNDPATSSRLYLIVLANDVTPFALNDDQDNSPSMDVIIRRKTRLWSQH